MKSPVILIIGLLTLFSCVPKTKFDNLLIQNGRTQMQRDSLIILADQLPDTRTNLSTTRDQLMATQTHFKEVQTKYTALQSSFSDVQKRYDELLSQNNILLSNSSQQVQELNNQLATKESELNIRERELKTLETQLNQKEITLSKVNENYKEYEVKIRQLESTLSNNQRQLDALKSNVINALTGFQASDLSVAERDGKIYVSLSQNLLFASGSDQIDTKGKDAISKVSQVLKGNKDFLIDVEGHTDATGTVEKNWDLSVRRATAVVKILTSNGLDPKVITASGRAFYDPISDNETEAGRAKNRRTDIILAPRLNELYQLVRQ